MEIQQFNDLMIVGAMRCADCNNLRRLRRKILRLYKAKRPQGTKKSRYARKAKPSMQLNLTN